MRLKMGSLQNCIMDNVPASNRPLPIVGMGATVVGWSDRHAATITAVSMTKLGRLKVTVRYDTATRTDTNGMSDCQSYRYSPDPNGIEIIYYQSKDGVMRTRPHGTSLLIGERQHYHDYSF